MPVLDASEHTTSRRRVFQNAATVGVLTSLAKIAAAAKVVITARYFGASDSLDAFLIAFLLPSFFVDTIAGTFTPSLIPELMRARIVDHRNAVQLARQALTMVLAAMLPVALVLAAAGQWMLPLLGSSFPANKADLAVDLLLVMLVWMPLGACSATWRAVLNAHNRVALAAAVPLATPAIMMLALYLGAARWGVYVLCASVTAGALFEFLVMAAAIRSLGYSLRPAWVGWTPQMLAIRAQYGPMLLGTIIVAGCGLVDQAVAGALGSGSVSALSYGTKFGGVLIAVGGMGMATAVLPEFSRLAAAQRWDGLRHALMTHTGTALLVMTPVTVALIWWSPEVVRLVYQHGAFTSDDAVVVTGIQRFSLLQVPLAVALLIVQRMVTALGASPLILRAGLMATIVNIVGDLTLPQWMGVRGVALSAACAQGVFLVALVVLLRLREPRVFKA